jgi:hypothetical protein
MDFLINLASNILANIIFWFGFGLIIWLIIQVSQTRFLKFFGLERNKKLVVYLSNLWKPTEGKTEGYVISGHEFRVTKSISSLFGSTPFRFPEIVRGLVDSFWVGRKLNTPVTVSPLTTDNLSFTNMIIVGSTYRNIVRKYYVNTGALYLVFTDELKETSADFEPAIQIIKGQRKNELITGDYNLAIVEKMYDEEHGTVIFMCAGYRGDSSWATAEYLVRHWQELRKKYGDKAFALCLGFPNLRAYMEDYEEPVILASFPY